MCLCLKVQCSINHSISYKDFRVRNVLVDLLWQEGFDRILVSLSSFLEIADCWLINNYVSFKIAFNIPNHFAGSGHHLSVHLLSPYCNVLINS